MKLSKSLFVALALLLVGCMAYAQPDTTYVRGVALFKLKPCGIIAEHC